MFMGNIIDNLNGRYGPESQHVLAAVQRLDSVAGRLIR